jgi:hypothetical protein
MNKISPYTCPQSAVIATVEQSREDVLGCATIDSA